VAGFIRRSPDDRDDSVDATASSAEPTLESIERELRDAFFGFLAFAHLVRGDPRIPNEVHHTAGLMVDEAERARALSEQLVERARTAEGDAPPEKLAAGVR
jgi:hypothetical protein